MSKRRHFQGTEKVQILKRHLTENVPVSDLCDEFNLYPNQIYNWLKEFFEKGHVALENGRKAKSVVAAKDRKIAQLEEKLQQKNEVDELKPAYFRNYYKNCIGDVLLKKAEVDVPRIEQ